MQHSFAIVRVDENIDAKEGGATLESSTFRSVKGRKIKSFLFGNGGPTALVIGGIHGDEEPGVELAEELINYLSANQSVDSQGRVVVMPVANPDGLAVGTRVNARGIDINRNFPTKDFGTGYLGKNCYSGESAASEPETVAILEIVSQFRPRIITAFHSELGCVNFDGPALKVAEMISKTNGLPVRKELGYKTPGSLGTYYGVEQHKPVITLELLPEDEQWRRHKTAILMMIDLVVSSAKTPVKLVYNWDWKMPGRA
jgi:murein peptide amidase A